MTKRHLLSQGFIFIITLLSITIPAAVAKPPLLESDLEANPLEAGWKLAAPGGGLFDGGWIRDDDSSFKRCLIVRDGYWQTPPVQVRPLAYYHVQFASRTESPAMWAAQFFDRAGEPIIADSYDRIHASDGWNTRTGCFRAHPDAVEMVIRFQASGSPCRIDNVTIREIKRREVAAWCDRLVSECPAVRFASREAHDPLLVKTFKRLRKGKRLRVVMLGDSICNDISNGLFETLVMRDYRGANVQVVTSVRGGTGCTWYQHDNRVQRYVLDYKPHLLIIAGISHQFDAEAIRSVIRQVRLKSNCEILVLSGAICPRSELEPGYYRYGEGTVTDKVRRIERFGIRLAEVCREEQAAFYNIRADWDRYIRESYQDHAWFMRDDIHANSRGKQIAGRMLARYFEPLDR